MIRPIPTSVEDRRRLRENGFEYVDKTHLITEFNNEAVGFFGGLFLAKWSWCSTANA